ncbi:MAG: hypothetical protein ABSE73_14880 [Planctomycetota bacterium]
MGDENIKAILERAAFNPAYLQALLRDREAALRDFTLEPHERAMLLAVPDDQLKRMVEQARTRTLLKSCLVKAGCVTAAAAALGAFAIPHLTRGLSHEQIDSFVVPRVLRTVADAEEQYKLDYGQFGSLEDLKKRGLTWQDNRCTARYIFEVTIEGEGESFTATARPKKGQQEHSSFIVGRDGVFKEIRPDGTVEVMD